MLAVSWESAIWDGFDDVSGEWRLLESNNPIEYANILSTDQVWRDIWMCQVPWEEHECHSGS